MPLSSCILPIDTENLGENGMFQQPLKTGTVANCERACDNNHDNCNPYRKFIKFTWIIILSLTSITVTS